MVACCCLELVSVVELQLRRNYGIFVITSQVSKYKRGKDHMGLSNSTRIRLHHCYSRTVLFGYLQQFSCAGAYVGVGSNIEEEISSTKVGSKSKGQKHLLSITFILSISKIIE